MSLTNKLFHVFGDNVKKTETKVTRAKAIRATSEMFIRTKVYLRVSYISISVGNAL